MTVAELQQFLLGMRQALEAVGAKGAGDLELVAGRLQPFATLKVAAFADLLDRLANPDPLPPRPKRSPARAKPVDPARQQEALTVVRALYDHATETTLTVEEIDSRVRQFAHLTLAELDQVAKGFDITRRLSSKEAALQAIVRKIVDRKGAYQRAQI